jgi:hypothetical protein
MIISVPAGIQSMPARLARVGKLALIKHQR